MFPHPNACRRQRLTMMTRDAALLQQASTCLEKADQFSEDQRHAAADVSKALLQKHMISSEDKVRVLAALRLLRHDVNASQPWQLSAHMTSHGSSYLRRMSSCMSRSAWCTFCGFMPRIPHMTTVSCR